MPSKTYFLCLACGFVLVALVLRFTLVPALDHLLGPGPADPRNASSLLKVPLLWASFFLGLWWWGRICRRMGMLDVEDARRFPYPPDSSRSR